MSPSVGSYVLRSIRPAAALVVLFGVLTGVAAAQGIATIQNVSSTPFVTGITPIIGSRGAVGGVVVDADGVVGRVEPDELDQLRDRWIQLSDTIEGATNVETEFRVISLAGLDRALSERLENGKPITPSMAFLAGLRRIEYVFAVPPDGATPHGDVFIAGPGGPWKANEAGEVVGVADGRAVLRLDDLMDALRRGPLRKDADVNDRQISCSIEPTAAGLRQFARVQARLRSFNRQAVRAMESAIGPQQVLIRGIDPDSHFAQVLLSADYGMKRLAMGFEAAPIDSLPSYMQLLQRHNDRNQLSSPRWWMASDYEPLRCTTDRLGWQIRGRRIRTLTQDSLLTAEGTRQTLDQENQLAQQWADAMTQHFDDLSIALPIFAELSNCFDLAVFGALMAREGLAVRADCQFNVLGDAGRLQGPRYRVPTSIPSVASTMRGRQGWIVSVSGGVSIDAWAVAGQTETDDGIATRRAEAMQGVGQRWWW
ncbi:DUF1598 domain-containing protein [Stieleria sp. ICT_E10.1]|uniref:DUF1598 domain-containing protein n=1 Tax=Stieleria sedimenti TaxID=2976331 RepID=UPI00217FBDBE|nr:DUF1598 domain-containing protein [Stieleria sedimenti]MCS7465224.1 DUF1598 domain-containing protein [Stieleria sedimenti]